MTTQPVSAVQAVKNPVEDGRDHLATMCVRRIKPQLYASYLSCNIELVSFFLYLVFIWTNDEKNEDVGSLYFHICSLVFDELKIFTI